MRITPYWQGFNNYVNYSSPKNGTAVRAIEGVALDQAQLGLIATRKLRHTVFSGKYDASCANPIICDLWIQPWTRYVDVSVRGEGNGELRFICDQDSLWSGAGRSSGVDYLIVPINGPGWSNTDGVRVTPIVTGANSVTEVKNAGTWQKVLFWFKGATNAAPPNYAVTIFEIVLTELGFEGSVISE